MSCTYDTLRAAGLVPELICHGCGKKISAGVVPWPGDGWVCHPNGRCSIAAHDKPRPITPDPGKVQR